MTVFDEVDCAYTLFERAARAWVRGNNSGDSDTLARCEEQCDRLRDEATAILAKIGVTEVHFPGLYPTVTIHGRECYSAEAAKAAIRAHVGGKK